MLASRRSLVAGMAACLLMLLAPAAPAQVDSADMLDQVAGLIERGNLNVEVDLKPGRAAITPRWSIETAGAPRAVLLAEADQGRVACADVEVIGGTLLVRGKGFRPSVSIERIRFEEGHGIVDARFRGHGIWRPAIAIFRSLARPALRRLDVPTDIRSMLTGQILGSSGGGQSGGDFLSLVREVHVTRSEFDAFPAYPLVFGDLASFQTTSLRAAIDKATFTPPARFEVDGRLDGAVDDGSAAFIGAHCRFAHGQLERGTFHVADGKIAFAAASFAMDLTSGTFHMPGGPSVGIEAPSRFAVRDLRANSDGSYSGVVDATVSGKVGTIARAGVAVAANDIQLTTRGARIADGKATGDIALQFRYRLTHTLTVHYPVEELRDRHVPLNFDGLFAADLHFEQAGEGGDGSVTGTYRFTIPWAPVERAAFEVLRARWQEDIAPAIRRVDFTVEPRRFGPCGGDCFLLDLNVKAEKPTKRHWLREVCDTQGKADVVVDSPTRTLFLRHVRVEPRCEGVVGSIVNFVAPLLTKSYSDVALLQMPKELPFTIDSVGSSSDSIVIAGRVAWSETPAVSTAAK